MYKLKDGDYLRVGNCIYRFLMGGNVETEYHEEIYRLTIIDGLTEIHNKRYLMEFLDRELARSSRHNRPLSLIMIDIDRFKNINDQFGHLGGDFTLRELAIRAIKGSVRKEELFARYGGEEFAVVLPETPLEGALIVADRILKVCNQTPFLFEDKTFDVTISAGVVTTQGEADITPLELIRRSDEKLYEAKEPGPQPRFAADMACRLAAPRGAARTRSRKRLSRQPFALASFRNASNSAHRSAEIGPDRRSEAESTHL